MNESDRAKAAHAISHPKFKAFMADNHGSSSLIVNGRADLESADTTSPLSLLAAKLTSIAEQTAQAFMVAFFSGQHRPYIDSSALSSPTGMMTSLLGQLITQMMERELTVDLSFLSPADWSKLGSWNTSMLCIVFRELSKQLPAGSTLLCIIGEITHYETSTFATDTAAIVRRLCRLGAKVEHIALKCLLTCHGRALIVSDYFEGSVLDLEENILGTGSSAWEIENMDVDL